MTDRRYTEEVELTEKEELEGNQEKRLTRRKGTLRGRFRGQEREREREDKIKNERGTGGVLVLK